MVDHSGHGCEQVAGKETKRGERPIVLNRDRKSTRLNSSHSQISYAVFCLKKKKIHFRSDRKSTRLNSSHSKISDADFYLETTLDPKAGAIAQGCPHEHSTNQLRGNTACAP